MASSIDTSPKYIGPLLVCIISTKSASLVSNRVSVSLMEKPGAAGSSPYVGRKVIKTH